MVQKYLIEQYLDLVYKTNIVSKTNTEWIITYVNDKFCEVSWYKREELIWQPHSIIRHWSNSKNIFKEMWDTIINKKSIWEWVINNRRRNDTTYTLKLHISPIFDKEKNVIEYISIWSDITDIERAKLHIKKSFEKLQELDNKKDEFVNIASHELRTPMTTIKGYISMLLDGDIWKIDDEGKIYLWKIYWDVQKMLDMINDMLDLSKIESGKINFDKIDFDFRDFLIEYINGINIIAKKKDIEISLSIHYDMCIIFQDKYKLKQVCDNLISNAIKFTPQWGHISVHSWIQWKSIFVSIKDTWIWIAREDIPKIFEKFWQVKNSFTRDIWWTGLGIPIVVEILKNMNSSLQIESELWKWSNFYFSIPL